MSFNKTMSRVVLFALIGGIAYAFYSRLKLNREFVPTIGKITKCEYITKSGGGIGLKYEYHVNSVLIKRSSTRRRLGVNICNEYFVGRTFPMVYNPDNHELTALLIEPDDFKRFGYEFPDSLKWVLRYIR